VIDWVAAGRCRGFVLARVVGEVKTVAKRSARGEGVWTGVYPQKPVSGRQSRVTGTDVAKLLRCGADARRKDSWRTRSYATWVGQR
jgi:hypothetical protein